MIFRENLSQLHEWLVGDFLELRAPKDKHEMGLRSAALLRDGCIEGVVGLLTAAAAHFYPDQGLAVVSGLFAADAFRRIVRSNGIVYAMDHLKDKK